MNATCTILVGDASAVLRTLPDASVQCCVTSPPYWGLRDYGVPGQVGLEATPRQFVAALVRVFREVRRVLKDDGVLWLNLGDSYSRSLSKGGSGPKGKHDYVPDYALARKRMRESQGSSDGAVGRANRAAVRNGAEGLAPKNLVGIPWRTAFALQRNGWVLRQQVVWSKPNAMPESVKDRCTRSHEDLFMLSKRDRYYYDAEAIRERPSQALIDQVNQGYGGAATKDYAGAGVQDPSAVKSRIVDGVRRRVDKQRGHSRRHAGFNDRWDAMTVAEQGMCGANKRSVWTIATASFGDEHFATFPPDLVKPCVLAGSRPGDTVLDPFAGSGTTGAVALELGRSFVGIELNPLYAEMARNRILNTTPGLPL